MKKIIEYIVLSDTHQDPLAEEVNKLIKQGFQPLDGVVIVATGTNPHFYQTMVKYGPL